MLEGFLLIIMIIMSEVNLEKACVYSIFKLLINTTFFIENRESHNCNKNAFSDFKTCTKFLFFFQSEVKINQCFPPRRSVRISL